MKITMGQLDAFATLMTVGTATAAASVLNTSQPSITRSLRQLEDATGLVLFNRLKGRLLPTAEAHELLHAVNEAFHGMGRIREAAEHIRRRKAGHLRIACLPAFSQGLIARSVADFLRQHPDVNISISPLLSSSIREAVESQAIDIGIAAYEVEGTGLQSSRFTNCNEVIVMRGSHPLRGRTQIGVADLREETIVRLVEDDPYRQRFDHVLAEHDIRPQSIVETQTSAGVCALVAQGVGVALVNPLTALDFVESGLVMRRFTFDMPFVTTLLRPANMAKSPFINAFAETLISRRDLDLRRIEHLCRTDS